MNHRILIIEDNITNLSLFSLLLKKRESDAEGICFKECEKALEWSQTNEPDLLLVDYVNVDADIDVLEFIQRFRAINKSYENIPVIMLTGDTESIVRYEALALGVDHLLTKPIDKNEFLARVQNLLLLRESQIKSYDDMQWLKIEIQKERIELIKSEKEMVLRLSKAAEHRDPETGQHLLRMANYSRLIARELGLSECEQVLILDAAPMHDIGKVGTPDMILLKPGRLNEEEFFIMKQHAVAGYNILSNSYSLLIQTASIVALNHHEKFDGTGYPNALKGEEIPFYARIVAVADVFDALTSERPYKKAWSLDDASQFLRDNSGSHFDPKCVEAFFKAWDDVLEIHALYQDDVIVDSI